MGLAGHDAVTSDPPAETLLGRDAELAVVDLLLRRAAAGDGGVLLVEGPAGIGKTRLLQEARERASASGMAVLAARAGELEAGLAFGVVRQLLEPAILREPGLLSGAAELAAPVLTGRPLVDTPVEDAAFATLHGLYWVCASLAEAGPLLLAVDDAHWADPSSLRFLDYLARRLEGTPLLLAVATRPNEPARETGPLADLAAGDLVEPLSPRPLDFPAVRALVAGAFEVAPEPTFCAACHRATGGNPFLLRELVRALVADGVEPVDAEMGRVSETGPRSVARHVRRRVDALPATCESLALAVAVLGDGTPLADAAALAGLGPSEAADAARALADADLFRVNGGASFAHPVVRSSIAALLPPSERSDWHRRAAGLLSARGAGADQVALHLLACEPAGDPAVVEGLRAGAALAGSRGAADVATSYLRRALEEPPAPDARPGVLVELGLAAANAGDADAPACLERALAEASDAGRRAEIGYELGRMHGLMGSNAAAAAAFKEALEGLEELGRGDSDLARRLEAELILHGTLTAETAPAALERLVALGEGISPDHPAAPVVLGGLASLKAVTGQVEEGVALAERVLGRGVLLDGQSPAALAWPASVLVWADRLDQAAAVWREYRAEAVRRGSARMLLVAAGMGGLVAWRKGDLAYAESEARTSAEQAAAIESDDSLPWALIPLVESLLERGAVEEAADALALSGTDPADGEIWIFGWLLQTRARLRLAQGRAAEALDDAQESGKRLEGFGTLSPTVNPWRSTAALALRALGREQEGIALAREEAELAGPYGLARGHAVALRVQGLLTGGAEGLSMLESAAQELEPSPARLEHARALVDLGAALRRAGRRSDARERLREAADLAARCGATALATRARDELLAAGARPRKPLSSGAEALTASERRVADMAADGMKNREIAQALFVTEKTVELHLSHAYGKLGISSRTQLAGALA